MMWNYGTRFHGFEFENFGAQCSCEEGFPILGRNVDFFKLNSSYWISVVLVKEEAVEVCADVNWPLSDFNRQAGEVQVHHMLCIVVDILTAICFVLIVRS
ncbi:hypothetical protein Hdeb2414_s0007g00234151 [Helianthus debilis subsp. tardiflorus]